MNNISIVPATNDDIDEIISIQNEKLSLFSKSCLDSEHSGFLVYPITKHEMRMIIDDENTIILVAKNNSNNCVVGYILSYNLIMWKNTKPNWESSLKLFNGINKNTLNNQRVLYLRHIARRSDTPGVGAPMISKLFSYAKQANYDAITGEIMTSPISNKISRKFHESLGFTEIGKVLDDYEWGLFIKILNPNKNLSPSGSKKI